VSSFAVTLIDRHASQLASFWIDAIQEGWYSGHVNSSSFPPDLQQRLEWYNEVVSNQMLSFVDDARSAIDQHHLLVRLPSGDVHPVVALHVMRSGDVSFRISPIAPPPSIPRASVC
jgi:hypothetical protein